MRRFAVLTGFLLLMLLAGLTLAQSDEPTPTPLALGPVNLVTATPTPIPPDDPRPSICTAPFQQGFHAHVVRDGDRLSDLLIGADALTITQIAALNCLDNPDALPVGAVIWLPAGTGLEATLPLEPAPNQAEIVSFEASDSQVQNFAGVTFRWETRGSLAYFYVCNPDPGVVCERPLNLEPVPLEYLTPIITFRYAGMVRYRLEVVSGDSRVVQDVRVNVVCSQAALGQYSGAQPCPDQSAQPVTGVIQPFQGGQMWWFSDTRQVYVLTNDDNRVQVFADLFQEGDYQPDVTPPDGLYAPQRGFARVWEQLNGADGVLGWATAPESGVDFARQPAGRVSYTTYIQPQAGGIYAVTVLPGQFEGVWVLLQVPE